MPQMSPMWWTLIYISSISILFLNVIIMFFYKNSMNKMNLVKNKKVCMSENWKW
uniref:ATP synthase F0 subunit 8 n=1 Tax=Metasalis populi TaxID=1589681 RepID=A0A343WNN9_9HEMI|nr:ATP synthase F0 subunit 8 [Metasalis populi]AWD31615.1 ATP synthase F0 subunit 8 [Metasalis populi]